MPTTQLEMAQEVSAQVLDELGLDEVETEVSLGMLEPLAELAAGGEVVPVERRDVAGGFGGTDLLVVTVVPAVCWVLEEIDRRGASSIEETLDQALAKVDEAARRTGSTRAADQLAQIRALIRQCVLEKLRAGRWKTGGTV